MLGAMVGRFRITERLGAGGMGEVYLAEDPLLGRRVAVKVLARAVASDPERRERLLHEARAASGLNHPNIVVVHDIGETGGEMWVAMERVEGETLRAWGRAQRSPADVLKVMRQVVAALEAAHDAGIVHRDLKPENIMLRADGLVKVLDFGLARSVSPASSGQTETMPGVILGTAPYMSPEQVLAQPAGPPSDLFSLGTIFYEFLTGVHPFAAPSPVETMHRILHDTPERASRVRAEITPDFDFVLGKLLAKEPGRRHASAHDLANDLEALAYSSGPGAAAALRPGHAATAGPRAIAVLPFKNIGGDKELAYLGIGLADAVITRLSTSPDLVVRATSSIARYEGQPVDPRHVANELGVTAVLDASFQKAGDRFRATARLVETPSGRAIWAGKVDVRFEDIFDVQDEVANGIATALASPIATGAPKKFTPNAGAYQLLLRSLDARVHGGTMDDFRRGLAYAEEAVAIQPDYAHAWVQVGLFAHGMIDGGFDDNPAWFDKANRALQKAMELDPEDPDVHFLEAVTRVTAGRKREAWESLRQARRRTPNNPLVIHYFAYILRLCDMIDEAIAAEREGCAIDPSVPWTFYGLIRNHIFRGDHAVALELVEEARARWPHHPRMPLYHGIIAMLEGRFEEALRCLDQSIAIEASTTVQLDRALVLAKLGRKEEARRALITLEGSARVDMDSAALQGAVLGELGEFDRAFESMEHAVKLGNDSATYYRKEIMFGSLFGDPRWKPFMERMDQRIAEYRQIFTWPPAP